MNTILCQNIKRLSRSCFQYCTLVPNVLVARKVILPLLRRYTTTPEIVLRSYQEDCISSCLEALDNNRRRIGVSLPTGGGKTVVFSNLIGQVKPRDGYGNKTMILAHRKELVTQAASTCRRMNPNANIQIEMSKNVAGDDADIVIASVQTLMRDRLQKFNPKDFKLIIVDEAHHAAAESYLTIFKHFGIDDPNSDVALIGFSATLQRDDGKHLTDAFDDVVFHLDTEHMVSNKHLCEAKFTTVKLVNADLGKVVTVRGEFVIPKLAKQVNKPENNEVVLRTYAHFLSTHKIKTTLVFGVDIAHVKALCKVFRDRGINADYVTSETKEHIRKETIDLFKQGKISVLMNCGIFTEGTDIPNIDCVLLVRPTKSKNLLIQMIGRGLRLHESKDFCHIVDFVGINNSSVISVPCLQGLPNDDAINGLTIEEMEERRQKREIALAEKEEADRSKKEEEERQKEENFENELRVGVRDNIGKHEIDQNAFSNSKFKFQTFESFRQFLEMGAEKEDDIFYIKTSIYPWIKIDNNCWIVKYPALKESTKIHLRLQRHKRGLTKEFVKSVVVTSIYKSKAAVKQIAEKKQTVYTLTSYTLNENYEPKSAYYLLQKKYKTLLLLPVSGDIRIPLSYVDSIFRKQFHGRDLTKFNPWRTETASDKQIIYLYRLVNPHTRHLEYRQRLEVFDELSKLPKGEISDFLLAYGVVGARLMNSFVEKLLRRAEKQNAMIPNRKLDNMTQILERAKSMKDLEAITSDKTEDVIQPKTNSPRPSNTVKTNVKTYHKRYKPVAPPARLNEAFEEPPVMT